MYSTTHSWTWHRTEVSGQYHAPPDLTAGKYPSYVLDKGQGGEEGNSLNCRKSNRCRPARRKVTVLTELQRLHTNLLCTFTFRPCKHTWYVITEIISRHKMANSICTECCTKWRPLYTLVSFRFWYVFMS